MITTTLARILVALLVISSSSFVAAHDCSTCNNAYYDGCNDCYCYDDDGVTVESCTRKECSPYGNSHCLSGSAITVCKSGGVTDEVNINALQGIINSGGSLGPCSCQGREDDDGTCYDCNNCDDGYSDGCNNWSCPGNSGKGLAASDWVCVWEGIPSCL